MADLETMDDKELFASTLTDEKPEPVETPEPTPQPEGDAGQPRDDQGRFAAKSEPEPVANPEPTKPVLVETTDKPEEKPEAHIPSWRLREVSDKRDKAVQEAAELRLRVADFERRFSELSKPKQEPVDFFADPDAAIGQRFAPIEQRMEQMQRGLTLRASKAEAYAMHGKDAVAEMETAIAQAMESGDPEVTQNLRGQMLASDDPVGVAMAWHQRSKVLKEVGTDPAAYRGKLSEELLKDPAFLAKALEAAKAQTGTPQPTTITRLPPSLNRLPASAAATGEPDDASDAGLFRYATAR